jgi:hypothetical protein
MFGLGKEKGDTEFIFDLERELDDIERYKEIVENVEQRSAYIKELMRKGEKKESFDQLVSILQGYVALLKVLSRIVEKKEKRKK